MKLSNDEIAVINQAQLAIVSAIIDGKIVSYPVPLVLSECQHFLLGHVARSNVLVPALNDSLSVQFLGANAYISPTWHEEQHVPTWNYVYCQVDGKSNVTDGLDKRQAMSYQTDIFESDWSFDDFLDANETMAQNMLNAIVSFRIEIEHCESKFKLSQHRSLDYHRQIKDRLKTEAPAMVSWLDPIISERSI